MHLEIQQFIQSVRHHNPIAHTCDCVVIQPPRNHPWVIHAPLPSDALAGKHVEDRGEQRGGGTNGGGFTFDPVGMYMDGWETFGAAWSNTWNPNASLGSKIIGNYYMAAWLGSHILLGVGVGLFVYGAYVAITAASTAGATANAACGGDLCASEAQGTVTSGQKIITVIGRFPDNKALAEKIGGNYLNISMKVWSSMSPAEQWERNKQWLQEAVIRGDIIRVASDYSKAVSGSGFAKELNYLFSVGYTISLNSQYLYPP